MTLECSHLQSLHKTRTRRFLDRYDPADSYLIILFANTSAERAYRYTHY